MKAPKEDILNIVAESDVRLSARHFIQEIRSRYSLSVHEAKKIVQKLIEGQELTYQYLYGTTYIEKSFSKPVRVSPRFVLKPPGLPDNTAAKTDLHILIEPGISFGSGQHPTTRLCLSAIDFCFSGDLVPGGGSGADIGTGSGVLAVAMCLAGLLSCRAYEIDPVSVHEARKNISLNRLSEKIHVIEHGIESDGIRYSIICANLRYPTLVNLSETICSGLMGNGLAVLSGFRTWETEAVFDAYKEKGFDLLWQRDDRKWSCFVLIKKARV